MNRVLKKSLSVFLAVVMMISAVPLGGFVGIELPNFGAIFSFATNTELEYAEAPASDFTYTVLDETHCSITGYTGSDTAIIIPNEIDGYTVQKVSQRAFYCNTLLRGIKLPTTLETIDSSAFYGCSSLKGVELPSTLISIGNAAFSHCIGLTTVDLPEGLTSIDQAAFLGCTSLTTMTIPEGITFISDNVFNSCSSLTNIELPSTLTSIGSSAFSGCNSLTEIDIPEDVTEIGGLAFLNCTGLTHIEIPENIIEIKYSTFSGCTGLTQISLPDGLISIESGAFCNCTNLESISLPDSITTLYSYAFEACTNLSDVNYPLNWSSTGGYNNYYTPFYNCHSLTTITIPEGVIVIPNYAFRYCTSLENVELPATLTSIGYNAFGNCTALTEINIPESTTEIPDYCFYNCTSLTELNLHGNIEMVGDSAFANCTGLRSVRLAEGITAISNYMFGNCTSLENVELPSTLTSIGYYAFENCTGLTEFEFPESITTLGDYIFSGCSNLRNINYPVNISPTSNTSPFGRCDGLVSMTVPEGVTVIPKYMFGDCRSLENVQLPSTLTSIEPYAFWYCTGLTEIEIPENVTEIKHETFECCYDLTQISLPDGLKSIDYRAFYHCTNLESITLPDSITALKSRAFENCTKLSEVNYPLNWSSVGGANYYETPFYNCKSLKTITIPEGVTAIPDCAFSSCSSLRSVILPDSLTEIGYEAFFKCTDMEEINIPQSVTAISNSCFELCTSLNEVVLHDNIEIIGEEAFRLCSGLNSIQFGENIKIIGEGAFYGCDSIVNIVLNEKLERLSRYAFVECDNLETITVPKETTVEERCFPSCPNLTVYCYANSSAHILCESSGYNYILIDDHEHNYIPTNETIATCEQAGLKTFTCTICGYVDIVTVDALGHDFSNEWTVDEEATCISAGSKSHHCSRCSAKSDVTAIAKLSHDLEFLENVDPTCTQQGYTSYVCSMCKNTFNDNYIAALGHTYNTTVVTEATVLNSGLEVSVCSECGARTERIIPQVQIDIDSNTNYGLANFTIVNAQTKEPISGACIFVSTDNDGESAFTADENGNIGIILPVGKQSISVYADGCITRNLKITVNSGVNNIPTIGLSDKPTYEATVIHHLMTYDEIIEAGIDPQAAENNNIYKYELELNFITEEEWAKIPFYWTEDGQKIIPSTPKESSDKSYIVYPGSNYYEIKFLGSDYKDYEPNAVTPPTPYPDVIRIYPVAEYFYLIVSGEVKWLKEMFDVEMLVINNSETDTLEDLTATLTLPEGLSLAVVNGEKQRNTKEIAFIGEGESDSVHWYVRGNSEGSYEIKALLEGTIMPFEEEIHDEFVAENALQVLGGSALNIEFEFADTAFDEEPYDVTITLTNVSDITLYNVGHIITGLEYGHVTHYSNGYVKKIAILSEDEGLPFDFADEFKLGDQIVLKTSINMMLDLKLFSYRIKDLEGKINGAVKIVNAIDNIICTSSPFDYNNHLASFCAKLCKNSYDKSDLYSILAGCGFGKIDDFNSFDRYQIGNPARTFAHKKLPNGKTLVTVVVTGSRALLTDDWATNIDAVISGYRLAGESVFADLMRYLVSLHIDDIENDVVLLITGHSQGGAATGRVVQEMYNNAPEGFKIPNEHIFVYTFAASNYDIDPGYYPNVKNIINICDIVPYLPFNKGKIGENYYFSNNDANIISNHMMEAYINAVDKHLPTPVFTSGHIFIKQAFLCPVDVLVYDSDNNLVAYTEGEAVHYVKEADVVLMTEGDEKYLYRRIDDNYTIKLKGTDTGTMTYTCSFLDQGDAEQIVFENIALEANKQMLCEIGTIADDLITNLYVYNGYGEIVAQIEQDGNETLLPIDEAHTIVLTNQVAPTCTQAGYTVYTCSVCGESFTEENSDPNDHTYGDWTTRVSATCENEGLEYRKCSVCTGEETRHINALGHKYSTDWITDKEATCKEEGIKSHHCTRCDSKTDVTVIAKKEHTYIHSVIAPTCTTDGYTIHTCAVCGTSYTDTFTSKTEHCDDDGDGYCDECHTDIGIHDPNDPSDNCSCNCHKSGISKFLWKIINFFHKLFKMEKYHYCECGNPHW